MNDRDPRSGKPARHTISPQRHDDPRIDQIYLPVEVVAACLDLTRLWVPVARRTTFDHVANENIFSLQTDGMQQLIQEIARRPNEGTATLVFVKPWPLPNEHHLSVQGTLSWYRLHA